jgi:hypothetical protein
MKADIFSLLVVLTSAITVSLPYNASAQTEEQLAFRTYHYAAIDSSDEAERFIEAVKSIRESDSALRRGYKGMAFLIQASHGINPARKLGSFNQGKEILNRAISDDPLNIELRYLRFTVQDNAPFFLGYSGQLSEDRTQLLSYLADSDKRKSDPDLTRRIAEYFREEGDIQGDLLEQLKPFLK